MPGFAAYRRESPSQPFVPAALHLLTIKDRQVVAITAFIEPSLFAHFGLPPNLS